MIENLTVGADPELFFITKSGVPFPACGLIGGTKEEPLLFTKEGHAVQEDNVAVEFCIPPSTNVAELIKNVKICLDHIEIIKPKGTMLSSAASLFFREEDLKSKQAKMFGCDATFNHWLMKQNQSPRAKTNLRSCGGHIHIGYKEPTEEQSVKIMAAMELFLGVPSIIMDTDENRRKLYGKSGEFRFKHYGFEWRVLSNFWIFSPLHISWVWQGIHRALEFIDDGNEVTPRLQEAIIKTINTSNRVLALELCEEFNITYFIHNRVTANL